MRYLTALLFFVCLIPRPCEAVQRVDLSCSLGDTIWADTPFTIDIMIENSEVWGGFSLGFHLYSPDGAHFLYDFVGGYGSRGYVTVLPDCRMYPPESVWDQGDLQVIDVGLDMNSPDTLLVGGTATTAGGLPSGPLQSMIQIHFYGISTGAASEGTFCIDTTFLPPDGYFQWIDAFGGAHGLDVAPELATKCWPVRHKDDPQWSPIGVGVDNAVNTMYSMGGELFVGGRFTYSAWWAFHMGFLWSGSPNLGSLGLGVTDDVLALAEYDNRLIIGGKFMTSGEGSEVNHIAAWDASQTYVPLGSGTNNDVYALAVYGGRLIAAGDFSVAGGTNVNYIASWDGISWSPVGLTSILGPIRALTVYQNKLIIAGWFTTVGSKTANHIAAWDGSTWSTLGSGTNDLVSSLAVYDGKLIVGGSFSSAGVISANHIASWDGANWTALGFGTNGPVLALTEYNGRLIAGGHFDYAGGVAANNIAAWDGSTWATLGSGTDNTVMALCRHDTALYVGGAFTGAGGKSASRIARWYETPAYICGDANGDRTVNIGDAVYVINFIFKGGPAPVPLQAGDANFDGARNVGDAVYVINYIFKGGPAPCAFTP